MSVKKSLWISLALAVTGLLFLGCPTEASSTEEEIPYEQTALWAAVVDAEADLNATQISELADDEAGTDVALSAQWVTADQATAFARAIGEASQIAKSGRAAAATPEEAEPLAKLAAAQKTFDGQKKAGTGKEVTTGVAIDLSSNINIITGNYVLSAATTITGAKDLIIAPGAKLSTGGQQLTITGAGALKIKKGGTLEITTGTAKSGNFTSDIIVEEGGIFINRVAANALLADGDNDTGTYIIHAGGVVIEGDTVLVGPSTGTNSGKTFQLNAGTLEIGVDSDEARTYELAGDATLVKTLDITGGLTFASKTSNLTVAAGVELFGDDDAGLLVGTLNEAGATIKLTGAKSYLTVLDQSSWSTKGASDVDTAAKIEALIVTKISGATWTFGGGSIGNYLSGHDGDGVEESGFRTTGPSILKLNIEGDEWVKQ
jgi:hypothetical protein